MIVFISWSGELSRKLGEILRTWLPGSLQYVKPYFTPEDIEKGARWNNEIAQQLSKSSIGILCLTPDNLQSPWLMFEAGALSKEMERSRICPILFELDNADLIGPLVQFQTTVFNRDDMLKLVQTVNHYSGDSQLDSDVLLSVFETWWPKLESQVQGVLDEYKRNITLRKDGNLEIRQDREVLEEVLNLEPIRITRHNET